MPFDLKERTGNFEYIDKVFTLEDIAVTETVASRPRAVVREAVAEAVRQAFFAQKLPFVRIWYYPGDYQSLFSFRFDMDEYHPDHHRNFLQLLREARGAVSCFACMRTYEKHPQAVLETAGTGVELASHGYVHHVYHNYRQNNLNLAKAEELLEPAAGKVRGFSAPHGKWHPSLQQVLEDRGYDYSSEFSLDYDNFPFFTFRENRFSNVLQIPTHPVCEGVFLQRYEYNPEMFQRYYGYVIQERLKYNEPVLIFGHPTNRLGKYPEIFRFIYGETASRGEVWKTEFRQISTWWKKRHALNLEASFVDGQIQWEPLPQDVSVHALFPDGRSRRLKADGRSVDQPFLQKKDARLPAESPAAYGTAKKMRLFLKKSLDWETKTPLEMLEIADPPSLVKKIMRLTRRGSEKETHYGY